MDLEILPLRDELSVEYVANDKTVLHGYKYFIDVDTVTLAVEIYEWMTDNINNWFCDVEYYQQMDHNGGVDGTEIISFLIKNDVDAMAFKLRWM